MSKKTVMVVDDESAICKVVEDILMPEGYRVITAFSGDHALLKLKKEKPDFMLIDFFMPGMSGRELCEKIRADVRLKSIRVAFITAASFSASGMEEFKRLNVLDYIKKPFEYKELIQRVKKIAG